MHYILLRGKLFGLGLRLTLKILYTKLSNLEFGMLTCTRSVKAFPVVKKNLKVPGKIDLVTITLILNTLKRKALGNLIHFIRS